MALVSIQWIPGFDHDIHLIAGTTVPQLDVTLQALDFPSGRSFSVGAPPAPLGSDITGVLFAPRFRGAPSDHGISVDSGTGAVTIAPSWATSSPRLNNFLIEARVTHTSPLLPISPDTIEIRVHIHEDVDQIWITPNPATGRKDAALFRLSLYAKFSDGVIGDISNWENVAWSGDPPVNIDAGPFGVLDLKLAGTSATITATLAGVTPATATVHCIDPWSTSTTVEWIDGPGSTAAIRAKAPNILFLPDGFTGGERSDFEALVTDIVRQLHSSLETRPFDLFDQAINYWWAFEKSEDSGCSVLSEVYPNPRGPAASWKPVPAIRSPVATATKFNLMELIHEVGLPIQTDAGRGLSSIVTDWQTLYDSSLTSGHVNHRPKPRDNLVWHQWRQLSDRRLVNERDTAFHSAVGGRLSSECETMGLARICLINNRRLLMKDFDDYVNGLRFGATIIGSDLWQLGHSGAASSLFSRQWLSDTTARKKDAGLICIISKARHYGGANAGAAGYYTSTTGATKEHRLSQVAGPSRALEILPPSFGRKAGPRLIAVVAHESAHSLRLLDEYASDCSHSAAPTTTFASNLQSRTELTTSGSFKGDDIKWLWPRIAKAGVLKDPPLPTVANEFIITLETGHAAPFGQGDEVRVRARPLPSNPIPSELFRIKSIHLGDSIEVVQISGFPAPNDLSIFPAESVLLAPVRVPGSAPNVADVKLVDDRIVEHINQTNGPLNAPQGNPTRDCQTAFDTDTNVPKLLVYPIQAARNLPPPLRTGTRKQPVYSSWIVGLYEGGQGMPCGIYHPTGVCLMRALQVPDRDRRGNPIPNAGNIYKFCPVCRYAMVDQIDPRKHEDIDVDYHAIYPQ